MNKKTDEKIIEDIFFQFPIGNADFSDAIEETIKQKNKQFQKKIDDIFSEIETFINKHKTHSGWSRIGIYDIFDIQYEDLLKGELIRLREKILKGD